VSVAGVTTALRSAIDHMDEMGKSAQKIGVPVEELSKLEYAGRLADVQLGALETSLARFSKSLSEMAGGAANPTALTGGYPGYSFDGGDILGHTALALGTTYTLCYWLTASNAAAQLAGGGAATYYSFYFTTLTRIYHSVGGGSFVEAPLKVLNVPFFLCLTRAGTTSCPVYQGHSGTLWSGIITVPFNNPLSLGAIGNYTAGGFGYKGNIYEAAYFPYALSAAQIRHLYESTRREYGV
jgi:hypothetical protein